MLRRKGASSGNGVGLPTSGGARSPPNNKGHGPKSVLSLQSIASHAVVAVVVFIIAISLRGKSQSAIVTTATSYFPHCPSTIIEYLNWSGNRIEEDRRHASLKQVQPPSRSSKKTPVPPEHRKSFYCDGSKLTQPITRALRSRGFHQVDSKKNAHIIYTYSNNAEWADSLKPWQRFNYIPDYKKWNKKDSFAYYYKQWESQHPDRQASPYVPETYLLTENAAEIKAFAKVLQEGGSKYPWVHKRANVNQGKGITIMAPESEQLLALPKKHLDDIKHASKPDGEVIIQRYVCNEMTWNRRKFDVRMYWIVASLDPLIILYHDGYVRIGNSEYSEEDFSDTTSHLTTHTGLGAEGKATMDEFEQALNNVYERNSNKIKLAAATPMEHVRNQFKHALGEMAEVFATESFKKPDFKEITSENGFSFYCADYILDNDLDAFFVEPQNGCGLDEDYYFRLEMHGSLFNGMVDVLEEVGRKQEAGVPVMPLENSGNWEVVYADGMVYHYDGYKRSENKASCTTK